MKNDEDNNYETVIDAHMIPYHSHNNKKRWR